MTEVVVTMLIVAVVVGVSIKTTRTKLDNIVKYNYFSSYQTLKNVTHTLYSECSPDNANYLISFINKIRSGLKLPEFIQPVYAEDCWWKGEGYCCNYQKVTLGLNDYYTRAQCEAKKDILGSYECSNDYDYYAYLVDKLGGMDKITPDGLQIPIGAVRANKYDELVSNGVGNLMGAPCGAGVYMCDFPENLDGINRGCSCASFSQSSPVNWSWYKLAILTCSKALACEQVPPENIPCGYRWSDEVCSLEPIEPWPPVCPAGEVFNSDECKCIPAPLTIPLKNFCPEFEARVNTRNILTTDNITEFCKGDAISDTDTDFSGKKPDLILPNGMRIYNMSQDYVEIPLLVGSTGGKKFTAGSGNEAKEITINTYGYVVYVDIDGKNSDSILWYDIFPFFITLDGKVIPAYKEDMGATGEFYLQTSIYDRGKWVIKSESFKNGACKSGFISENSKYCKEGNAVLQLDDCKSENSDCTLKIIKPSIFIN